MKPKISVIMPAYNAALYIREAIESVLNQSFQNFEFIIINDGSTDETLNIIQSFNDSRIVLINNSKNLGIIKTRNIGLQLAKGEYIAKMDADDVSLPMRFEIQNAYLDDNSEVAVISSKLALMDEKGVLISIWPEDYYVCGREQIKTVLPIINCIGQPTVMIRTKVLKQFGYNNKYINGIEDWGLWLDLLSQNYIIDKLDQVLLHYRVHNNSITVSSNVKGTQKRIVRFKLNFLYHNVFKFNWVNRQIIKSVCIDILKLIIPTIIIKGVKILKIGPIKLLKQFFKVKKQLAINTASIDNLFFFPYYHSGGAEKVHASILETVSDKKNIVFITDTSNSKAFLSDFEKQGVLIEIDLIKQFGPTYKWLKKQINSICKLQSNVTLFGCNSMFYYQLIDSLPAQNKVIDLVHAFVHEYEPGPEKWSLPVVTRIDQRIIISENSLHDFEKLYIRNGIHIDLLQRVSCISNFIETIPFEKKVMKPYLDVLYVGRGSSEKRIHLISQAANICHLKKLNVRFHFVGNVNGFIPEIDLPYCKVYDEIHDVNEINKLYQMADILLITSTREGFPMVIMEAMINGVVPIATNVGGVSNHIKTNETGILIDENNEHSIVELIVQNLEYFLNNRIILDSLSLKVYDYAQANFRKDLFFKAYNNLLT